MTLFSTTNTVMLSWVLFQLYLADSFSFSHIYLASSLYISLPKQPLLRIYAREMSGTVTLNTQCCCLPPVSFSMPVYLYPSSTASSGLPIWLGWLSQCLLSSHHCPGRLPNSQPPPSRKGGDLRSGTGTGEKPMRPCQHSFKEWSLGMKVSSFNLLIAPVKHQMSWKVKGNALSGVSRLPMHGIDP